MGRGQARRISQRFFYRYLCMSYVDLNPTPASSDYTSIQARIQTYQSPTPEPNQDSSQTTQTPVKLIDFIGHEHKAWLDTINYYDRRFFRAVGTLEKLKQFANRLGQCWLKGQSAGKRAYKQRQPLPT